MILIYEKINNVRKLVDYVKKDATVQGYKAVSHDAVTGMIREALVSEGVLVFPSLIVSEDHATGQSTKSGAQFHRYKALYEVKFVAAEDASEVSINVEAHADDHGDKAPGKALSYATKYAMLKVFSIETGEDDESRQSGSKDKVVLAEEYDSDIEAMNKGVEDGDSRAVFLAYMGIPEVDRELLHAGAPNNKKNWGPFTSKAKNAIGEGNSAHFAYCRELAEKLSEIENDDELLEAWDELDMLQKERVWGLLDAAKRADIKQAKGENE